VAEHYQVSGSSAASISASIETAVRNGDYVSGAALPPIRDLAGELQVSPATVAKAYQELRQRGVVETAGRRGTKVRSRPALASPRSALRLPVPPGVVDLASGEPDVRLLPDFSWHLKGIATTLGPPVGYATAGVMPGLADAARPRLRRDHVPVAEGTITVTSGTLDAIERLLTVYLRPGDTVAVEDPGWTNLLDLIAALGLRTAPIAVDDEGPLPDALDAALAGGALAVIITARAQNPTGATITASRAGELRAILRRRSDVLLIEDDHAAELAGVPLHTLCGVTRSWAFARSASKPYGPDLRVAVLAGDEATIARVVGRMRIGAGWVSTLLQQLLLRLWRDGAAEQTVTAAAAAYDWRRRGLCNALSARGLKVHGATGINTWVRVPDETHTVGALRDAGYAVAAGSLFRIGSPPGIRITVSALDDEDINPLADAVAAAAHPVGFGGPSR
jgi:DNA-binding transcriptional MocR family regulator